MAWDMRHEIKSVPYFNDLKKNTEKHNVTTNYQFCVKDLIACYFSNVIHKYNLNVRRHSQLNMK